jgi:hypothetical protein
MKSKGGGNYKSGASGGSDVVHTERQRRRR